MGPSCALQVYNIVDQFEVEQTSFGAPQQAVCSARTSLGMAMSATHTAQLLRQPEALVSGSLPGVRQKPTAGIKLDKSMLVQYFCILLSILHLLLL